MENVQPSDHRVTYSNSILFSKSPIEAMEALQIRKSQIKTINKELAEWFTAYGRQRLRYVEELKKLHQQGLTIFSDENLNLQNGKLDALGLCKPLWSDTLKLVNDEITLFDQSTRKMGRDMIAPLKLFNRNNDTRLIEMDEITELAANIQLAQTSNKDPTYFVEQWSRKAPDFFATFEAYDYERLVLLKDIFSKYQSDVSDVNEIFEKHNEQGLEHALNLNIDDEIDRFSKNVTDTTLPIENINVDQIASSKGSRTTTDGFTKSKRSDNLSTPVESPAAEEPHHRRGLFHNNKKDKRLSSTGSSLFSTGTTIGPSSKSINSTDKKEKVKIRSKFGSIFKGRKGKKNELNHPNTIAESDSASVITGTTQQSRARTQSVSSSHRLSMPNIPQQHQVPVDTHRQSAASMTPPVVPAKDELASPIKDVKHNVYEPMVPTKRNDSLPSLNSPLTTPTADNSPIAVDTLPTTTSTIPQTREMNHIPENEVIPEPQMGSQQISSTLPPPLPSSRKHVSSEPISVTRQQPHGSVPIPPQQRKNGIEQPNVGNGGSFLQPAPTGSNQQDSTAQTLAHNTTGGGGLATGQIVHPSLTTPGLNASIVELFNASFKDGELVRSNAIGEIAFSFINEDNQIPQTIELQINSNNGSNLPNFMVNPMFLEQGPIDNHSSTFKINDASQLLMRTVGGLKYMLNNPIAPIVITPIWKHEDKQSTVIISIKPVNSESMENFLNEQGGVIKLTNVLISASIQGALVSTAATKPSGTLNKDKGRVTWLAKDDITFSANHLEERYVARFMTNQLASESESGVQVKFNISNDDGADQFGNLNVGLNILAKGENVVEDPFGDGETSSDNNDWMAVPTLKSIVSGSYTGHS